MPLYLFECPKCHETVELLQSYNDAPPICPRGECQEGHPVDMVRKIGATSFILKGSGWARDLYTKKGK